MIPSSELYLVLRFSICPNVAAAAIAATIATAGAQQPDEAPRAPIRPDVSLSPFVAFLPRGNAGPMTGLALMLSSGPLALRAGGHLSLQDRGAPSVSSSAPNSAPSSASSYASTTRSWGADADAIAFLETISYGDLMSFAPYVFTGVSTAAVDSASLRINRQGWSYGGGLALPLGSALGVFGEWRWRMSRFMWPNSDGAPSPVSEVRIGVAFHIGGGPSHPTSVVPSADDDVTLAGAPAPGFNAQRVLSTAEEFVGTPYRRGGSSPSTGFDAAGFVRFVFARLGVVLPRTSREQARVGQSVRADWHIIAPGDLVMFQDDGGINHVAIYVGRSRIIHSSETGGGVRYDDLSTERGRWFLDHMVAARRVTPDVRGLLLDLSRGYTQDVANNSDGPDHAPRAAMRKRP